MFDLFKKRSSSNWEDSYFGGYRKILLDYPYVKTSEKLSAEFPSTYELGPYSTRKLLQIFLVRVKEYGLSYSLLKNAKKEDGKLVVAKSSIIETVDIIIEKDNELSNLFKFYKEILSDIKLEIKVSKDEEEEGKKSSGTTPGTTSPSAEDMSAGKDALAETEKEENPWNKVGMSDGISYLKGDTRFVVMKANTKPCVYSADETLQAKLLVEKLDISFDPEVDRVDGLRMGKLDTAKLASIPAGDQNVYYTIQENMSTKPFSVCMLMDESGSMGGPNSAGCKAYHQHKAVKMLFKCFSEILPLDKIYVYGHSGYERNSKPEIRVYQDKLNPAFEYTIDNQGGNSFNENYDGPVIEAVYEKVRSFTDDNIIFISLSDGQPSGHGYGGSPAIIEMKKIIEKCKRDGFVTVGIGLEYSGVRHIYNYNTVIDSLKDAASKISMLINNVVKKEFQQ